MKMTQKTNTGEAVLVNAGGVGPFVLVCEHASHFIPPEFDNLGLEGAALKSHIAWDPGAAMVAEKMAGLLDSVLVKAGTSRLVYDCNRPPEEESSVPKRSEIYTIPGNRGLTLNDRLERAHRYYEPFRDQVMESLAGRIDPVILTIHSFTPVYQGEDRAVQLGIIHDADSRMALALADIARRETDLNVAINDPYGPEDGVTHTLVTHGIRNGLMNVMIEIRNDLIATTTQQHAMAVKLAGYAVQALALVKQEGDA